MRISFNAWREEGAVVLYGSIPTSGSFLRYAVSGRTRGA